MRKRVLLLDQHSYWGGGQRVLKVVVNSLRDQIDPIVALPEMGTVGRDLEALGIRTCTYPLGSYRSGTKSLADLILFGPRSAYAAIRLASVISGNKSELVYINGSRCLPAGVLAARLTGRPALFCLHQTLSRGPDIAVASRAAKCVSHIVACSHAAADSLLRADRSLAAKLQVLYPPVEALRPDEIDGSVKRREKADGFTIGMVGRITQAKGHHVLLAALGKLGASIPSQAVFVGAPAPGNPQDALYVSALQSLVAEHRLTGMVQWVGYQPDPTPFYANMDVLVVASTGEEGMPLVALEAFQRGIPVIASRLGGLPELVKDGINGMLVSPGKPEELARALQRLQGDPAFRLQLGAAARATIDHRFSREYYCSAIGAMISELCPSSDPVAATPALRESRG